MLTAENLEFPMPSSRRSKTAQQSHSITWLTETLRVTAFTLSGASVLPNSWEDIIGVEPSEILKQPPPMQSFEAGPLFGGRLSLGHQPGRIELLLTPEIPQSPRGEIADIGDLSLAIDQVLPIAKKLFRPDMTMQRLGVGAVLLYPVASMKEAYKFVISSLPVLRGMPENGNDFFLQINVPITVAVTEHPNFLINRVIRWHTAQVLVMNMFGGAGVPSQIAAANPIPVSRVEIDVNTPADLPFALSYQIILEVIDHLASQVRAVGSNAGWFPE